MAFERRSGWAESAGNKPVVRWQNGLWNGLALFLSIGTERNKFRTNGPKWKIVLLTGPNWTDGNLGCKGGAKNSEIPNSSSQRQGGSSTGSSRIAFLWYSFILRTYTFIHLYILESFKLEDRGQHWTYDHLGNTVTSLLRPYIFLKKKNPHYGQIFFGLLVIMDVYHLQKVSGKSGWKVNRTGLFGAIQRKISGSNGTSEKVVLSDILNGNSYSISSKPSLIPVSSLFTDPLFSFQSPSSACDKI